MWQNLGIKCVLLSNDAIKSAETYQLYSLDCHSACIIIIIIINIKINVALSENASRTQYTIKTKLKLRK